MRAPRLLFYKSDGVKLPPAFDNSAANTTASNKSKASTDAKVRHVNEKRISRTAAGSPSEHGSMLITFRKLSIAGRYFDLIAG